MDRHLIITLLTLCAVFTATALESEEERHAIQFCSNDSASASALCFDSQFSFDLSRSRYDQYDFFSTPDFSRPLHGVSTSGIVEMHFNYTLDRSHAHLGFVYFPKAYESSNDTKQDAKSTHDSALRLDEAYVMLMPLDWVPLAFKFGSAYSSFSKQAINLAGKWSDYPSIATPSFLMTHALTNMIAMDYDDHLNSGLSASVYLLSESKNLDQNGKMESWGADARYYSFRPDDDTFSLMLGLSYVSNGSSARFIPEGKAKKQALAVYVQSKVHHFVFELSHVHLNSGQQIRPRALDFTTKYFFEPGRRYVYWGWSQTSDAEALNLPKLSWWLGAYQKYNDYSSIMLNLKRQDAYDNTFGTQKADYLYGLRYTLDLF